MRTRNRRSLAPTAILMVAVLGSACGDAVPLGSGGTISPDRFIDGMVALRTSPLLLPQGYLPDGEPERILAELGLEPDDLRAFVEVHGEDIPMMGRVWTEVEVRVTEVRQPATEPGS